MKQHDLYGIWMFSLINKSEIFSAFVNFCTYVDNLFQTRNKILESDGGGEIFSSAFKDYVATHEIMHFISC